MRVNRLSGAVSSSLSLCLSVSVFGPDGAGPSFEKKKAAQLSLRGV